MAKKKASKPSTIDHVFEIAEEALKKGKKKIIKGALVLAVEALSKITKREPGKTTKKAGKEGSAKKTVKKAAKKNTTKKTSKKSTKTASKKPSKKKSAKKASKKSAK